MTYRTRALAKRRSVRLATTHAARYGARALLGLLDLKPSIRAGWSPPGAVALRRDVRVKAFYVQGARVARRDEVLTSWLRARGAFIPRFLAIGTFLYHEGREFRATRRGERLLVFDCESGAPFVRIVLNVSDPEAALERLGALGLGTTWGTAVA